MTDCWNFSSRIDFLEDEAYNIIKNEREEEFMGRKYIGINILYTQNVRLLEILIYNGIILLYTSIL